MDALEEYREKRDFTVTKEPRGGSTDGGNGVYCLQRHIARRDHFDLRLEYGGALLSFAVPKGLPLRTGEKRLAVKVENHPLEYAEFEGTIPKGQYGGGTVMLADIGRWRCRGDMKESMEKGEIKLELIGRRIRGNWAMVRTDGDNFLLIKERGKAEILGDLSVSVRSGRSMEQIARGEDLTARRNPFGYEGVMLAKSADTLPEGGDWTYEIKFDGYRMTAFVSGGKARLVSRGGGDYTAKFPEVAAALEDMSLGREFVLDGEIVVYSDGKSDFSALAHYRQGDDLRYEIFDLLALDGEDLRALSLKERREKLRLLADACSPPLSLVSSLPAKNGSGLLSAAFAHGLEGIMAKREDSRYVCERSDDWLKVKCRQSDGFVVGGYVETDGGGVKALLLGEYDGKELLYVGRVGGGMSDADRERLKRTLSENVADVSPFARPPKKRSGEKAVWCLPVLLVEVAYAERMKSGTLRQPSFKGVRAEKAETAPKDKRVNKRKSSDRRNPTKSDKNVTETVSTKNDENGADFFGVTLSSPDKTVYNRPKVTKADVARYYAAVAERMLPFLRSRALSVVRCHGSVDSSEVFFKKHPSCAAEEKSAVLFGRESYIGVDSPEALLRQVQLGTLEFHCMGAQSALSDTPDIMAFDFDPDENLPLSDLRRGVTDIKEALDKLGLRSYLKTSGGKGYHVVVPIEPRADWEEVRDFSRRVAEYMQASHGGRYTANIRKAARDGKIFIDWQRNIKGATFVSPYSLRARDGAGVSMPIEWSELFRVSPSGVDIFSALKRLKESDPWSDFFGSGRRKGVKGKAE